MQTILKKNDEIRLEITALSSSGSGVGHYNGIVVFVEGTAIGDIITAHIIKVKSSYAVAIIKKILSPSKSRIESDCPVSVQCGGCSFRHIKYSDELEYKRKKVQDALQRIGKLDINVDEILHTGETSHYRNKAQYPIGMTADGRTLIGFYAKRSHRIVNCRNCSLQPIEFEKILEVIEKWAAQAGVSIYNEETKLGLLRHIYIRKARKTRQIMVCLVSTSEKLPKLSQLTEKLISLDIGIKSIVLNINSEDTNVVLSQNCKTIYGSDYIEDELCSLKFRISPLSFYQVNPAGAEILYNKAREFADLKGNEVLLDLYCGTGTIGLSMAKDASLVIGVEVIPQAIENAKQNAEINQITNSRFICDDASGAAKTLLTEGVKPNVVVLDPPRKGCSPDVLKTVSDMNPERIVYVSCDPATLARDCAVFSELGYECVKAVAVDMFPRTVHVETVVLLSQRRPDTHIDIKLDLSEFDITAAETKATYQEIKDYVFEKFGLKVSSLYISQVKRKLGLEVGDSYNKAKSDESKVPKCPIEKERAIKSAFKFFKIIE